MLPSSTYPQQIETAAWHCVTTSVAVQCSSVCFRGVYCAFCRRAVAGLARLSVNLAPLGIQTLGVVATPADHARLYFKHHRVSIPLAADPAMTTHAVYGLPKVLKQNWDLSVRINPKRSPNGSILVLPPGTSMNA